MACKLGTLSWHCHRAAVTPLPGVSAPAGLRPSPQEPLFAAAQPSLCPVSADKAGQLQSQTSSYHDNGLDLESTGTLWFWNLWPVLLDVNTFLYHNPPSRVWAHLLLDLSIGGLHNYLLPSSGGGSGVLLHGLLLSQPLSLKTKEIHIYTVLDY